MHTWLNVHAYLAFAFLLPAVAEAAAHRDEDCGADATDLHNGQLAAASDGTCKVIQSIRDILRVRQVRLHTFFQLRYTGQ